MTQRCKKCKQVLSSLPFISRSLFHPPPFYSSSGKVGDKYDEKKGILILYLQMYYCSKECRDAATYHQGIECETYQKFDSSKIGNS